VRRMRGRPVTADRLALAVRTMKARRRSRCPACTLLVLPGMAIAKLTDPQQWVHLACVPAVAAAHTTTVPAQGGAAQEGTT
jgi:hypothetical protein